MPTLILSCFFFFSSRRRHTRSLCDWSSDVCSSDLTLLPRLYAAARRLLVIAEPVRNLSQSRRRSVRWLARALTRTADGRVHVFRYTEGTLLALYDHCKIPVSRLDRTPSRYELVVSSLKAPSATADVEARRRSVTDSHTGVGRSPR